MTQRTRVHGLQVATELYDFIEQRVLPGTGVGSAAFWKGFDAIVADLAPKNAALLAERDRLQAELDKWHGANPGPIRDMAGYRKFLETIGYLVPEPRKAKATTRNVDDELATQAGITGWAKGEALQAVRRCFEAWLGARGHMDNGEEAAMLRQVRGFLEANGEGRFAWWHRAMDDHTPKTLNRAGFRRLLGTDGKPVRSDAEHQREYGERMSSADGEQAQVEFIVLREVFRREVCQGFDADAVAKTAKRQRQVDHDGRLPDATLSAGDRDDGSA